MCERFDMGEPRGSVLKVYTESRVLLKGVPRATMFLAAESANFVKI